MSGSQIAPSTVASASTGTGTLDVSYDKGSKTLTYKITWSGLSDSVIAIRICGPAPVGYPSLKSGYTGANPYAVATTPYAVIQEISSVMLKNLTGSLGARAADTVANKTVFASSGTYSGLLGMDDVYVKEADLLNGLYYITIHTGKTYPSPSPTTTLVNPAVLPTALQLQYRQWGEIRGQIKFQ